MVTDWKWPNSTYPKAFGWFHDLWLLIMVLVCILLCKKFGSKHNKRTDDVVIFSIGLISLIFEIYKQIFFTIESGYYNWDKIPFQFCSVPMYVALIAPILKEGRIKDVMYKFIAFFGLLSGCLVMIYPVTCLHSIYISMAIHTMVWHVSLVVMGVYLQYSKNYTENYKGSILPSFIIYTIVTFFALFADIIAYNVYFKNPTLNVYDQTFNMFYISPYYSTGLGIFEAIKLNVPYILFLLGYMALFIGGTSIIWLIVKAIRKAANSRIEDNTKENEV